ncbi:unnamed protein product [Closterium sp. NIES-53]
MPPFYILVYIDNLVFATADTEALALVKLELQKRHTCTDLALRLPVLLTTVHSSTYRSLALSSTFGRVPSWHATLRPGDTDQSTGRPVRGCSASCGVHQAWGSCWEDGIQLSSLDTQTRLGSSCEAEIYAGAMAAQELSWLTYLLTDLGEWPRSPLVLYEDNKAMIALCQEHRLEHRTKHIALRYFLARELQQHGQLRLAYMATSTRRKWLVNTAGARAVGEHWHRYQADLEEREVREEQEEPEVQEEQEEQGAQGVQVAMEALLAHGYTTRRR